MLMVALYFIHIIAGIFWAGTALFLTGFLQPAVNAAGPAGGAVMNKLVTETRFSLAMSAGGGLTVLTGLVMYWLVSRDFSTAWFASTHGILISAGGAAGIVAVIVGFTSTKGANQRMGLLAGEIQAGGQPPSAAQQAELEALKLKMRKSSVSGTLLILIAIVCMALARTI